MSVTRFTYRYDSLMLCSVLLFAIGCDGSDEIVASLEPTTRKHSSMSCGPVALTTLLHLEGRRVASNSVNAQFPDRPRHSMAELRQVAHRFGMELRGVRLDESNWPLDRPALVLFERRGSGHFAILRSVGHSNKLAQVIDPNHEVSVLDVERIFASPSWTGAALIPTRPRDLQARYIFALCIGLILLMALSVIKGRGRVIGNRDTLT